MPENISQDPNHHEPYHKGLDKPVFVFEGKSLFVDPNLSLKIRNLDRRPVATWGGENAAIIDGLAFDVLERYCGDDTEKFKSYLRAITEFEILHSDSKERHEKRLPIEEEILQILEQSGYFDQK